MPKVRVLHKPQVCKLQIQQNRVLIKIEVSMVGRGIVGMPVAAQLCQSAQEQFDAFCAMPLVPLGQLYGGKICAALDRQHLDVRLLLDNEGLTDQIRKGLVYAIASSSRPTHELLSPNFQNQQDAFTNQFEGMSALPFTYQDFEQTRQELLEQIRE